MLDKELKISIIVATYNRSNLLDSLLQALVKQYKNFKHKEILEFIVVNNNSNDNTKEVAQSFLNRLPMTYIEEKVQGVCKAQNTGILHSTGDLICFIDDDVIPKDNWLEEVFRVAYYSDLSRAQGFCGKIEARIDGEIPSWLNLKEPFSISHSVFPSHNYGDEELRYPFVHEGTEVHNPIGANFIFTRKVFQDYDLFREDLGPGSQEGLGNHGDTEFARYLMNHNVALFYKPSLHIIHPVIAERVTKQYIRLWYKKCGYCLYWFYKKQRKNFNLKNPELYMFVGLPGKVRRFIPRFFCQSLLAGIPLYLLMKLVLVYCAYIASFLLFRPKLNFWLSAHCHKALGEILAARKLFALAS